MLSAASHLVVFCLPPHKELVISWRIAINDSYLVKSRVFIVLGFANICIHKPSLKRDDPDVFLALFSLLVEYVNVLELHITSLGVLTFAYS